MQFLRPPLSERREAGAALGIDAKRSSRLGGVVERAFAGVVASQEELLLRAVPYGKAEGADELNAMLAPSLPSGQQKSLSAMTAAAADAIPSVRASSSRLSEPQVRGQGSHRPGRKGLAIEAVPGEQPYRQRPMAKLGLEY